MYAIVFRIRKKRETGDRMTKKKRRENVNLKKSLSRYKNYENIPRNIRKEARKSGRKWPRSKKTGKENEGDKSKLILTKKN